MRLFLENLNLVGSKLELPTEEEGRKTNSTNGLVGGFSWIVVALRSLQIGQTERSLNGTAGG